MMSDQRFEAETPFSEADIRRIETELNRKLPKDYCEFVMQYGGCFVGGTFDGSEEFSILAFLGPGKDRGVLGTLSRHRDLKEDGVLPFANCELGNLYVLDRKNIIHYINYYGGKTIVRKVSESFGDFISRIVVDEE